MLDLRAVACVRGRRTLFSDLSCSVAAGQMLRVRGANGAGKTSLLRMVCGLLPPTAGEVAWRGQAISGLAEEFGSELLYIGHAAALKDDLSAAENLQLACLLGGLAASAAQIGRALQQAGMGGREHMPVRQFSQGQRRRVALARLVLAVDASLWVLDEPFNALDAAACDWLCLLIAGQLARGGVVMLTSHQEAGLDRLPGQVAVEL